MRLGGAGRGGLLLALVVTAAACGSSTSSSPSTSSGTTPTSAAGGATPGITPSTITVGQVDTLSGPVPGLFEGAKDGTQAYLNYINSKGGVDGRKLRLDTQDDAFSGANYATETQQLVNRDFALVGGFSLFDASGVPAINSTQIPDVTFSLSEERALDPYNYSPDPLVVGGTRLGPLVYYKQHYPTAIKHVGTIFTNVATAEAQSRAVFAGMSSLGYQIVYQRIAGPLESDFTADVLKMRANGVQAVYIVGMSVGQVADLAKDMQLENFKPAFFSTNGVAYDSSFVTDAGSAAEGVMSDLQAALFGGEDAANVPAVSQFDTWVRRTNPQAHLDTYAVYGWASAELFVQALQSVGPNPTRPAVLAALNKITSFDASGLIAEGNPAQKVPETCWILAKVSNGKWVRTGPAPKSGFVCNPGGYYYPPGYQPFKRP